MGPRSAAKLATCHPDLIKLFQNVDAVKPITICQGERPPAEEAAAIAAGKSKTSHSKHVMQPSMAVDASPSPYIEDDRDGCIALNDVVIEEARKLGLAIRWGGAWSGTRNTPEYLAAGGLDDLDHWELHLLP